MKTHKNIQRIFALLLSITIAFGVMCVPVNVYAATTDVYTITYHLDGGTNALKNPSVYTAEDTIILKDASKVGYDFAGWFSDSDKTKQITQISGKGNVDIYAKFIAKVYTTSFNGNGADECGYKVTLKNDKTGEEKYVYLNSGESFVPHEYWKPEADGYVYAGWMYESEVISNTLKINSDIVLVPKWIDNPNNYPVIGDDQSQLLAQLYLLGDEIHEETKYFYTSYDYATYSYECVTQKYIYNDHYYSGDELKLCTACSVNKKLNNGSWTSIAYHSSNSFITGERTGLYSERDWGTFSADTGDFLALCTDFWGRDPYGYPPNNVWIVVRPLDKRTNIGKVEADNTVEFDSSFNAPSVHKSGYTFLGWYDSQGNQITDTWQYTENQTFTAKWEVLNYDITYKLAGGTNNASNPAVYTTEDTITLKAPTKPGYTFKGWYSDANFTTQVTSISKGIGNITLYAKWAVNSYNLTLNANEGGFAPKVTFISDGMKIKSCYLYEQDTITAYRPTGKDGYIFAGWYTDSACTSLFKFNGTISNDTTLYAKWIECAGNTISIETENKLSVSINGQNGKQYAFVPLVDGCITVTSESNNLDMYGILYNSNYSVLTYNDDISDTDLDFSYTYSVKAGQLYYITVKGNTASTVGESVVNVDWTGECKVTGTTYKNRDFTVVYGTKYTLPQKPVREGYVFLGWFDENDTQITEGTWDFVSNKTLTAKWEEATYHTVVFKDLAGNIISSETYYLSEDIVAPELPTKAPDKTYIYHAKWDNDYTGICTGDAVYSPTFDSEFIEYTVVFVNADGTELSRATYHWGDEVAAPATPTKAPDANYANIYTFTGWDSAVVNCAGDTTYTATYTAVPLKELMLISQPNQVRYRTGESLNLTGLKLQCVYANDANIFLDNVDARFVSVDLSTPGKKTVTVTLAGKFVEFEIYVHDAEEAVVNVDKSLYPQSSHSYSNNLDETKTFTYPGAQSLIITFDSRTSVENNYDYIYIYDGAGKQVAKYTGTTAANKTLTIPGDTFKVKLVSDNSYTYWGYAFSSIKATIENMGEIIHQPVIDPATVTCTQAGLTEGSHCEICGDILVTQEEVDALGHNYAATFDWAEDHASCTATVTCTRNCGKGQTINCTVTINEPNSQQTKHTATAEYDGQVFTDTLTCEKFLVSFVDWDGTKINSTYYHKGDEVIVPDDPTREADDTYTYKFAGWDKAIVNCNGIATYKATYDSTYIDYTVTFKNWDGTILSTKTYHYGDKVTAPTNPTKPADNTYTYKFAGWDKAVVNCNGNTTYTATYDSIYIDYTVTFKNWDGTVLSTKTYHYGDKVTAPTNPTKPADNTYTYKFAGWNKTVVNCVGNATYTARYTHSYIDYTVTFKDWDGTVLSTKTYHYGDKVTAPANPTKPADNTCTYKFAGWDKAVVNCNGNTTYTATYDSIYIDYTVTFKNWDGTILSTGNYHYGDMVNVPINPTKPADVTYAYTFAGWDKEVVNCVGNTTYTAVYETNYIDYVVEFKNWNGDIISSEKYHYGDEVEIPSNPSKETDDYYTYTFMGWDKDITVYCNGNAEYTATFEAIHYHNLSDWLVDVAPSCSADGLKCQICTQCGEILDEDVLPATGHTPSDWFSMNGDENLCKQCLTCCEILETSVKLATPELTKVANTASGVKVTWYNVYGADNYIVYRRAYNTKTKKWGGWTNIAKGVTSTSYLDKTAKSGTYYLYTVRANNEAGLSGYNTAGIKTYFISTPKISSTANTSSAITVKWGKVTGATGYIVYRKTGDGKWQNLGKTTGVSFTDKTAKAGVTYRYTIKAYYGSYVSAYNTNGTAIRRLATPALKSVTSAKSGVTFSWNKVTGATGYIVYRKTGNGGWQKLATVTGNAKISYLDKTAKKGTTYTYTVKAYYGTSTSAYNTKGLTIKDKY